MRGVTSALVSEWHGAEMRPFISSQLASALWFSALCLLWGLSEFNL